MTERVPKAVFFVMVDILIGALALSFLVGVIGAVAFIVSHSPMVVIEVILGGAALWIIGQAIRRVWWGFS